MKKKGELIFLVLLLCLSIFLFLESIKFPLIRLGQIGAGVWPACITGILIFIITVMLAKEAIYRLSSKSDVNKGELTRSQKYNVKQSEDKTEEEKEDALKQDTSIMKMLLLSAVIFIYIWLLQVVGFIFSTPLFMASILKIQKYRISLIYYITFIIGGTLLLVICFSYVFGVYLPRGTGIFRELSRIIY